jgi:hypothetical protein
MGTPSRLGRAPTNLPHFRSTPPVPGTDHGRSRRSLQQQWRSLLRGTACSRQNGGCLCAAESPDAEVHCVRVCAFASSGLRRYQIGSPCVSTRLRLAHMLSPQAQATPGAIQAEAEEERHAARFSSAPPLPGSTHRHAAFKPSGDPARSSGGKDTVGFHNRQCR